MGETVSDKMKIVLIKEMREGIETKTLLCYPKGLGASPVFASEVA